MESLIEEAQELIDGSEKGPVRDAAQIGATQKVEHVEIATYGTLATLAEQLGYQKAKQLLAETRKEEKAAEEKAQQVDQERCEPQGRAVSLLIPYKAGQTEKLTCFFMLTMAN